MVGRDPEEDPEGRRLLEQLAAAGHELANHSYAHRYELTRLPRARIAEEIDRGHAAVAACAGTAPAGFRAPGYETSAEVIDLLVERGYAYDSSTFPAVPYYLAKAAVMGGAAPDRQEVGQHPGPALGADGPPAPYRPRADQVYRRGDRPILELPMTVTPGLRVPVFGTALITAPAWLRRRLVAAALRQPFFNLELHGIDLCDAEVDGAPPALIARQPDLRWSLAHKRQALAETLAQAREAGARFQTLREFTAGALAA